MSYTVLARKYRSQTFDDLVGQEAIATTLKNAVSSGRVHHGYLFTGTRGVGKTSSARVLAKALNCFKSDAPTPTPCCACESCERIAAGEDIDVIEIDAASNTGVDNIRDLRDNAGYRPARSRYKVYIIDEVHMLSTGAFNALLKTLEEPPGHVKFILATTEIHKVPATIVSRCQRFDFRSIASDAIARHLKEILDKEKIEAQDVVLRRVSRLANGSMRDGLSLLDQLLSFGSGTLTEEVLDDVLPTAHDEIVTALFDAVGDSNPAEALHCVEQSLSSGQTIERLCEMMVQHLRALMLLKVCGGETDLIDASGALRERLAEQASRFDAPSYVHLIALCEETRRAVKSSHASRALVDALTVRLALARNFTDIERLIANAAGEGADEPVPVRSRSTTSTTPRPAPAAVRSSRVEGGPQSSARSIPPKAQSPPTTQSAGPMSPRSASPADAPRPPVPREAPTNSADHARARGDAHVREAMELFDATLVDVRRAPKGGTAGGGALESEDDNTMTLDNEDE